jgi:hypothetical protein
LPVAAPGARRGRSFAPPTLGIAARFELGSGLALDPRHDLGIGPRPIASDHSAWGKAASVDPVVKGVRGADDSLGAKVLESEKVQTCLLHTQKSESPQRRGTNQFTHRKISVEPLGCRSSRFPLA